MTLEIFDRLESEVRGYIRSFPIELTSATGTTLVAADGTEYLDFFAGAGVLNYGHNHPELKKVLLDYIAADKITHGLDLATTAKREFMEAFEQYILKPRGLKHKIQFTGPTGTNAVEAALKLARQAKGRANIVAFTNAFHGVSVGSLAATGNIKFRDAAGAPLPNITRLPYDGYIDGLDSLDLFEKMLNDPSSGLDKPAAVILEPVQGEGGIIAASIPFLQRLREITEQHDILLILDEIQAGVGRTGTFFAFEAAEIIPDLITVSKSISGYGLPMAILLLKPEIDVWTPAAHSGTFRGNNLAFATGKRALELFWADDSFQKEIARKSENLQAGLEGFIADYPELNLTTRGRGFMRGIVPANDLTWAGRVAAEAFKRGLIIETSGAHGEVLKFLIALNIEDAELERGLAILRECMAAVSAAA
ncbi:diaminobutyrate--2-oxoglutarate transaminase [Paenarthrobacter sp. NPDC089714]|uniref:diaminobutyrate--2-oxoglutarate transaminase n=1 Tax=Paenarthrobacter sp. NPDC089714 TaxID=3364377 RepID=UPI003829A8CE